MGRDSKFFYAALKAFDGEEVELQGMVIRPATARWSWGRSLYTRARLIHRVDAVVIAWRNGVPVQMAGRWECHPRQQVCARSIELLPECGRTDRCPSCFEPAAEPVVYYAERNGLIKIGRSHSVSRRVLALGADLLATEPGDGATEAARHTQFEAARVAGEWFRPSPELLRHIRSLVEEAA